MGVDTRKRGWLERALARLGRALDPGAAADREQLRTFLQTWRQQDEVRARRDQERLKSVEASVESISRETRENQRHLTRVRQLFTKQRDLLSQVARRTTIDRRAIEAEHRVTARLARLSRSALPVIVGPWTGEVGFELLYWIPFLQWMRETFPFDSDRLIVVSRGGVGAWYGHVSAQYEEIFRYRSPAEFHAATVDRKKQQQVRLFDRSLVKAVMRARHIKRAHIVHPTLMYGLYNAFWRYTATIKQLEAQARFRTLGGVSDEVTSGLALPKEFVAVRFYFSDCFPDTPDNRAFASRVVDGLAARGDVVLLNSDIVVDDHRDFSPTRGSRVHVLSATMHPEINLALQSAVISRATAFVGTYGGYSYLAPLYGVSSVAFHSRTTFKQHHLELAHRAFLRLGSARLVPVDVRRAELLADALAGILTSPSVS
jgi:hypothetical protein